MRDLSIVGKIIVFKTLAISKIVHLGLEKTIPNLIILELNKIQKEFIWKTRNPKIKKKNMTLSVKIKKMEVSKMLTLCIE